MCLARKQEAAEYFKNKEEQFSRERVQKKVEDFCSTLSNSKEPNVRQKKTGVKLMPIVLGRVQYSMLRKDENREQIKEELRVREVLFDPNENWTSLIGELKENEGDKKTFKPKSTEDFKIVHLR